MSHVGVMYSVPCTDVVCVFFMYSVCVCVMCSVGVACSVGVMCCVAMLCSVGVMWCAM